MNDFEIAWLIKRSGLEFMNLNIKKDALEANIQIQKYKSVPPNIITSLDSTQLTTTNLSGESRPYPGFFPSNFLGTTPDGSYSKDGARI